MEKNKEVSEKVTRDIIVKLDELHEIDILYKNITSLIKCPRLLTYCRRLLTVNGRYVIKMSETSIKTDRNGEKLNISIDLEKKRFMLCTTEWNQSDINRIYYKKDEDGYTFASYNNDVSYNDGINRTVVKTLFNDKDQLIYTSKEIATNLDFYIRKDHRVVNKNIYIEIFILNDQKVALQRAVCGDNINFYLIEQIPILLITGTNFFEVMSRCSKKEIDEDVFQQMKRSNQKFLKKVMLDDKN